MVQLILHVMMMIVNLYNTWNIHGKAKLMTLTGAVSLPNEKQTHRQRKKKRRLIIYRADLMQMKMSSLFDVAARIILQVSDTVAKEMHGGICLLQWQQL